MSGRSSFGDYVLASFIIAAGLFIDYMCVIAFEGWLSTSNPWTLATAFACGLISVFLFVWGLTGFLLRPAREARVVEDKLVLQSEWRFDAHETVIPLQRVWKFYANLTNDFPYCFVVWKDEKDRCHLTGFDKEDLPDFQSEVAKLKDRIPVDTESYAIATFVRKDMKEQLGCEPAW